MPELTLSVVLRNEAHQVKNLLDSFEEKIPTENESSIHFLFIDNCSSDNTVALLESWKASNSHLKIQILQRSKNSMAEARQMAVDQAKTDWVSFVDADTILESRWFEKVFAVIKNHPAEAVAIGGGSRYRSHLNWHHHVDFLAERFPLGKKKDEKTEVLHVPTNNLLVKVSAVKEVGGFDPYFERVGEDLDLCVRLRRIGRIIYDPSFSVIHNLPKRKQAWYAKMAYYGRAQSYVFLKYGGEIPILKFVPLFGLFLSCFLILLFPLLSMALMLIVLLSPNLRFWVTSVLIYGAGELVGAFQMILSNPGRLFGGKPVRGGEEP